jgi:hypothetical protein
LDDFFNGGNTSVVNNNIASFETWHRGKPAQIFSLLDVSAIPLQAAQLTESALADDFAAIPTAAENATATAAEIADDFLEILSNTDATQAKVDQL